MAVFGLASVKRHVALPRPQQLAFSMCGTFMGQLCVILLLVCLCLPKEACLSELDTRQIQIHFIQSQGQGTGEGAAGQVVPHPQHYRIVFLLLFRHLGSTGYQILTDKHSWMVLG